jgi:hypothetical protein
MESIPSEAQLKPFRDGSHCELREAVTPEGVYEWTIRRKGFAPPLDATTSDLTNLLP